MQCLVLVSSDAAERFVNLDTFLENVVALAYGEAAPETRRLGIFSRDGRGRGSAEWLYVSVLRFTEATPKGGDGGAVGQQLEAALRSMANASAFAGCEVRVLVEG